MTAIMNPGPDIDRLLVKRLLGEATEEERLQAERWCAQSPGNERYAEDFQRIWEESAKLLPGGDGRVDENAAWERFRRGPLASANSPAPGFVVPIRSRKAYLSWAAVAASLVLLIGAGVLFFMPQRETLLSLKTQAGVLHDTLPDGSEVTLNMYSILTYPEQFRGNTREVRLQGEGFFHIAPDARHPFRVSVNGLTVLVLGTSFNVRTTGGETEVIVETGQVEVERGTQTAKINPGERVVASDSRPGLEKTTENDALYQYYRTKQFVCRATPLRELARVLEEAYNVPIVIKGKGVGELPLTATFRDESLDSLLGVVATSLGLTMTRNEKEIILQQ
jgi:ferric-dicitrate binding protein FerR (iron transport regulator)